MNNSLNVAICENTTSDAQLLRSIVEHAPQKTAITMFSTAEDFLSLFSPGLFDIVFMDIYLIDGNDTTAQGVAAIEAIRRIDSSVMVAFTTTSKDHALDGYRLDARHYLLKPVNQREVYRALETALQAKEQRSDIVVRSDRKDVSVRSDQVVFLEQKAHYYFIHMVDGSEIRVRGKIADIEDQLGSDSFFRCHQSFLVNLAFIQGIDNDSMQIILYGGARATIRRNWLTRTRTAWENWMFEMTRKKSLGEI